MNDLQERILEFIRKHHLGVIATTGPDGPEAAVVEYGETNDLELIFDTLTTSRKYFNISILQNTKMAFVIGWDTGVTVQYEGNAAEIFNEDAKKYKDLYFHKNPRAKKWESREGIAYFKVTPTWIRYSDLAKDPWEVLEWKP